MKKKLYYYLSDNADLSVYLKSTLEVMDVIDAELFDMADEEKEEAEYTIKPVYMTEEEFNEIPEW